MARRQRQMCIRDSSNIVLTFGAHNLKKDSFLSEYSRGFLSISNAYKFKYDFCLINSFNKEAELYPIPKHISKTFRDLPLNLCKLEVAVNFNFVSSSAPIKLWKFSWKNTLLKE